MDIRVTYLEYPKKGIKLCNRDNEYPSYEVSVLETFPGYYILSNEMAILKEKKEEYEQKLECINKKLGR